jgi:FkbH-like protein
MPSAMASSANSAPNMAVIGVAATFTCEPVGDWLQWWLAEALGRRVEVRLAAYAALQDELHSPVAFRGADACVGLLRMVDWQPDPASFDAARFDADLTLFIDLVRHALAGSVRRLLLVLCPAQPASKQRTSALAAASNRLQALALDEPRLSAVSASDVKRWYPCRTPYDPIAGELGHLPYTDEMCCALGGAAARSLLPSVAPPLKAIVVDCDYTLWDHAVGEVGPAGAVLHRRHIELQKRLLALRGTGVLLCLCSRNAEPDVWAALARDDMPLCREHVSAHRIAPTLRKPAAVDGLARALGFEPESVLFIDDNPAEIAEVRAALPQLSAWVMPQDDAVFRSQLQHVWQLDLVGRASATHADTARAASRAAEAPRAALRAQSGTIAAYHRALAVEIVISRLDAGRADAPTADRVIQLHERSNQFNAWKRAPPTPDDMHAAAVSICARVSDRYGDYGIVGAAVCGTGAGRDGGRALLVRSFVMSCRVLGRGVEHAMASALGQAAASLSPPCTTVGIGMSVAPRNQPIRAFLRTLGGGAHEESSAGQAGAAENRSAAAPDVSPSDGVRSDSALALSPLSSPFSIESPDSWIWCEVEQLCSLRFDPEAEAEAEAQAEAERNTEPEESGAAAAFCAAGAAAAARQADCLALIPLELQTVGQALQRRGGGGGPLSHLSPSSRADDARTLLRAIWRRVLRLPASDRGEDADAQLDASPFEALGGDSTSAVQAQSLAAQHGMRIRPDAQLERLSIGHLVQMWEADRDAASAGGARGGNDSGGEGGPPSAPLAPIRVGTYHYGAAAPPKSTLTILERDGRTPSADLTDRGGISACASGDVARVRALAAAGWPAAHAVDKFGSTALMWSSSYGQEEAVRWLVEEERVPVNVANKVGRTAVMFAAKYGQLNVARYLLHTAGADVTLRMRDDSSAFDWAVFGGHRPTMELLVSHPRVDVRAMNRFGCAAVQWAAAAGNVDTCRWLMAQGLDLGHVNAARHGAVSKAAWKGHDEALRWLLFAPDGPKLTCQLAIRDPEGRSVAQLARINGQHATADWLQPLVEREEGLAERELAVRRRIVTENLGLNGVPNAS